LVVQVRRTKVPAITTFTSPLTQSTEIQDALSFTRTAIINHRDDLGRRRDAPLGFAHMDDGRGIITTAIGDAFDPTQIIRPFHSPAEDIRLAGNRRKSNRHAVGNHAGDISLPARTPLAIRGYLNRLGVVHDFKFITDIVIPVVNEFGRLTVPLQQIALQRVDVQVITPQAV